MIRKFYHGTNNKSANSILNNGIDIKDIDVDKYAFIKEEMMLILGLDFI